MSDQEVIKHSKKILKIWRMKENTIVNKLKEFVLEIITIVLAVSITIWLHNWNGHRHEQIQVKSFLLGLKKDISLDIADSKEIIAAYKGFDSTYTYISSLSRDKTPNSDSLKLMLPNIRNSTFLRIHKSRFTGFLSAGKIMTIEEDSLALNILYYYEEVIPALQSSEGGWLTTYGKLNTYLTDNVKDINSDLAKWEVLTTPKGKYLTKCLIPWQQLFDRYENVIESGEAIIKQIDKAYPNK